MKNNFLFLFAFLLIGIGTNNLQAQDSDGDGIANNLDLDDDNDGILDTVECPSTYVVRPVLSSSVTANKLITYGTASQIIDGEGAGGTLEGPAPYWYTDVSNLPIAFSMNMQSSSTIDHIKLYAPWGFDEWIGNFRVELYNSSNTLLGTENLTTPDQYIGNPIFSFSTEYTNVTRIRFTILSSQGYSIVDPPRASLKEIVFLDLQQNCDTDGDGIPNHLDLDSDNDGCPDAIEGGASLTSANLVSSSMPGGNSGATSGSFNQPITQNLGNMVNTTSTSTSYGVPTVAGSGQTLGTSKSANPVLLAGTAGANQTITSGSTPTALSLTGATRSIQWQVSTDNLTFTNVSGATNATYAPGSLTITRYYRAIVTSVGGCTAISNTVTINVNNPCLSSATNPDSDGDGISDYCDLDDDNDGILDTAECTATDDEFLSYTNTGDYLADIETGGTNILSTNPSTAGAGLTRIISLPNNYMELSGIAATTEAQAITNNEYVEYSFTTNSKSSFLNNIGYYSTNYISTGEDTQYHFSAKISNNNFSTSTNILNDTNYDASTGTFIVPLANGAYLLSPNTTYKVRVYFYAVNGGASATIAHDDFNLRGFVECDTDGDGIPNRLDLDSDNDGCVDAFEGDENVTNVQLTTASGTVTVGIGSTASNQNLGNSVDANGVPTLVNSGGAADVDGDQGQGIGSSTDATVNNCFCYKPATVDAGNTYPTKHGITALGRAGADNENWPMVRQSAWTVLESKEKGFVVNRVNNTADLVNITNPVEGMMVYDNQANCLKIYTLKSGDTLMGWHCFTTPACPD
ncbi:autotransporter outer membrane beta-barrel domain-containing protein [Epilithonimonas tenax]|uniref:hypothetical protein n=1 Tax=Epilithonimonas tenax TaxID=191577 RepID=UPI00040F1EE6|nr:hypothetical protein [Epilithonimonas tenax]